MLASASEAEQPREKKRKLSSGKDSLLPDATLAPPFYYPPSISISSNKAESNGFQINGLFLNMQDITDAKKTIEGLSGLFNTENKTPVEPYKRPGGGTWRRLWTELIQSGDWEEIDPKIDSSGYWRGGSYASNSSIDTQASYRIELVSLFYVKWTAKTPASPWYPGTHSGYIELPHQRGSYTQPAYPFNEPRLYFQTPCFSPFPNNSGGISVTMLWGEWSPAHNIKKIMEVVVLILTEASHTLYEIPYSERLPGIPLDLHSLNTSVKGYYNRDADAGWRAANFFARTYAQVELELIDNPVVTPEEIEGSVVVVSELLAGCKDALENVSASDVAEAFQGLEGKRLSEWREEERRWTALLAPAYEIVYRPPDERLINSA